MTCLLIFHYYPILKIQLEDRNKYINMISDGDPHFFIFVEKRGNQYIPLDVENINGDMTNME